MEKARRTTRARDADTRSPRCNGTGCTDWSRSAARRRWKIHQRRRRRDVSANAVTVAAAGDAVAAAVAAAGDAEGVEEELEIIFAKLLCDVSVGAVTGRRNKPPRPKALASRVPKKESRLSGDVP